MKHLLLFFMLVSGMINAQTPCDSCPIVFNFTCPDTENDLIIFSQNWIDDDYIIPEATISLGDLVSEVEEGDSSDEFLTITTTYKQFSTVATYTYTQTRSYTIEVKDLVDDPAPVPGTDQILRTITVSETITQISNSVSVTTEANPNWADPEVERLANGLANARWRPSFEYQQNDFIQIRTFETVSETRTIEVTKEGGEWTYEWSSELDLGFNVNGDGDYWDNIRRGLISEATYFASHNLGWHVKAPTSTGWVVSNNFHTAQAAYDHAVDKIPAAPDVSTRQDREDALTDLSPTVDIFYSNLVDYYGNELSTNYHIITIGEYVWDGTDAEWALQDLSDGASGNWYFVWYFANDSLLKIKYGI